MLLADDRAAALTVTEQASVEADTAPTAGHRELVSLWQMNLVALRATRFINWHKRRAGFVRYISGVTL